MARRSKEFQNEVKAMRSFCGEVCSLYRSLGLSAMDPWTKEIRSAVGRFDLLILGKYNAGKSSLLNLLLSLRGTERLPTHIQPTTKKLWKIGHARSVRLAGMRFQESKPVFSRHGTLSSILAELESDEGKTICENIDFFELGLPVDWLKRTGWFFWDSPGKDDPDKLLDDDLLKEALTRADAVLIATAFEQHASCRGYIEQAAPFLPACWLVVLTNSGKRPAEEFAESAAEHLQTVCNNLSESLSAPTVFTYTDSNSVSGALEKCSDSCTAIQNIITQWKAGSSVSKEQFSGIVAEMEHTAGLIEQGGLFSLWQSLEVVHSIEESLILCKAWSTIGKYLDKAELQALERRASAQSDLTQACDLLNEVEGKASVVLDSLGSQELADLIKGLTQAAANRRAKRARENAQVILAEQLRKHNPKVLVNPMRALKFGFKRSVRAITFGKFGGRVESEAEEFQKGLMAAMKSEAERFVGDSVWPLLQGNVADAVSQARNQMAAQFSAKTGKTPVAGTDPIQIEQLSGDELETAITASVGSIWDIAWKADFRTSEAQHERFLEEVESSARHLTDRVISIAAKALESPLGQESEDLKRQAIAFSQREISLRRSKRDDCDEAVRQEQQKVDAVLELKSRCVQIRERHYTHIKSTINNEHQTNT